MHDIGVHMTDSIRRLITPTARRTDAPDAAPDGRNRLRDVRNHVYLPKCTAKRAVGSGKPPTASHRNHGVDLAMTEHLQSSGRGFNSLRLH
jgi:hypothetical protein